MTANTKKLLLIILLQCFSSSSISNTLGLEWGLTSQVLEKKGVKLSSCENLFNITSCKAQNLPQKLSFGAEYSLFFDAEKGLISLVIYSDDIKGDERGAIGKSLFAKIETMLDKKYHSTLSFKETGSGTFESDYEDYKIAPTEFYHCLKNFCGNWVASWRKNDGTNIYLRLDGLSPNVGKLMLSYQSEAFKLAIEKRDKKMEIEKKKIEQSDASIM